MAAGAVGIAGLTGCGAAVHSGATSAKGSNLKSGSIAFLMPDEITERWDQEDKPVFLAEVHKICPQCTVDTENAKGSADTQLAQVQSAIANGVKVIVLAPTDISAAAHMASLAHAAGVKFIAYASTIDSPSVTYLVTTSVPKIGAIQAQDLIDGLKAKGVTHGGIVMLNGDPNDDFGRRYKSGAMSVFDKYTSSYPIVATYMTPQWDPSTAETEMNEAIAKVGKDGFVGVYAANDDLAGGAIAAMKNAGIDPSSRPTTGQDGELAALQRVIAGTQYDTINLPIKIFAAKTADLAVALSLGKQPPAGLINGTTTTPSGYKTPTYLYPVQVIHPSNVSTMIAPNGFWALGEICTPAYAAACKQAGLR